MDEVNRNAIDQNRMPFLESLVKEKNECPTAYHMPGHKGIQSCHPLLTEYFGGDLYRADLVEINGSIDYLHSAKGALLQSQELASSAYGVDWTYFLVNGSTVGNLAGIMSVVGEGQKILVPRASHRSVYGGIVLSGAIPIYIEPEYHPDIGFPLAINIQTVERLLNEHDDIVAIHVTSPNYYGVLSDIGTICQLAHSRGICVIVDEAHGSHLKFHNKYPRSSISYRADLIIHSTHKTQSSLTQSAMLHLIDNGLINRQRLHQVLSLLQTSSPSSILLASLDASRMQMSTQGYQLLSNVFELSQKARQSIQQIDGLWCYGDDLLGVNHIFAYDPSKLIVRVSDLGLTGYQSSTILRNQYQIQVEFSSFKHLIFSITIADNEYTIDKLIQSLYSLTSHRISNNKIYSMNPPLGLPLMKINLRDAYFTNKTRSIPLNQSIGSILAENIIPYPPGVPLLVPGEILEENHLNYIKDLIQQGGSILGLEDLSYQTIRIID